MYIVSYVQIPPCVPLVRPNIKRGNISPEEEDLIVRLHRLLGNRWSLIAGRLPGRTETEIKNHWNTIIRRKIINDTKQCQSDKNKQKNEPSDEIHHSMLIESDVVHSVKRMKVSHTVVQQSQQAKNLETDDDADQTQDGNSGNGNVEMKPNSSSNVDISSRTILHQTT